MTLVAFRMSNKGVVYGFIHILLLIQIGDSLNPDDRITGLEKELSIVKTDLDVLKSQVVYLTSLLNHGGKGVVIDSPIIDIPEKTLKPQTEPNNEDKEIMVDPTLEERLEKVEQLTKVGTLRSCEEYAAFGIRASGLYPIDPDGLLVGQEVNDG